MRAWLFALLSPAGPHCVRYSAALRSYEVPGLFIGAELNDLEGVSILPKKPGTILGFPFQTSVAVSC